jgi:hypothetical protein
MADPKWSNGDYYGRGEPLDGITRALKIVTLTAVHRGCAEKAFGYKLADEGKKPADAMGNLFQIEDVLQKTAVARARTTDANNKIYMAKADQLYTVESEVGAIKAKSLFVPASSDLVFPPEFARRAAGKFRAQGGTTEVFVLERGRGAVRHRGIRPARERYGLRRLQGFSRWSPCRKTDPERRALPFARVETDACMHQRRELTAQGEPQSGAAEFAGYRAVGLTEALEYSLTRRLGDAASGVAHRKMD